GQSTCRFPIQGPKASANNWLDPGLLHHARIEHFMCSLQLSLRMVDTLVLRHNSGLLVRGNPALPQLREGEMMDRRRMVRVIAWVASAASALCLVLLVALTNVHSARAAGDVFKICKNQIYALCAAAHCFVLNDVAYCKCDVEFGDSISLA